MVIIVDFPIENGGSFHSYVKLPEGTLVVTAIHSWLQKWMFIQPHDFLSVLTDPSPSPKKFR